MLLLVVDMQKGLFTDPRTPRHDARGVIQRINRLISAFRTRDRIIDKKSCDAFLNTDLSETIAATGTDQVVITGCATEFCVDTVCGKQGAEGNGGIRRQHLDAKTIITHHNWIWENLILEHHPLRVTETIEKELS